MTKILQSRAITLLFFVVLGTVACSDEDRPQDTREDAGRDAGAEDSGTDGARADADAARADADAETGDADDADAMSETSTRGLGVAFLPRIETGAGGEIVVEFDAVWDEIVAAGIEEPGDVNLDWGAVDPGEGAALVDPDGALAAARVRYAGRRVALTLAPIQTLALSVPSDLAPLLTDGSGALAERPRFDDRRIVASLEFALAGLEGLDVWIVSVGNEPDALLAGPEAWESYARFVAAVRARVEAAHPGILVGTKLTRDSLLSADSQVAGILDASSAVIATYYPVGEGFAVVEPVAAAAELAELAALRPELPLYIAEIGYPSSPELGSSPEAQGAFVEAALEARRGDERLENMCWVWWEDPGPALLDVLAESAPIPGARAFFGSLGLRRADGSRKPGAEALERAIEAP